MGVSIHFDTPYLLNYVMFLIFRKIGQPFFPLFKKFVVYLQRELKLNDYEQMYITRQGLN